MLNKRAVKIMSYLLRWQSLTGRIPCDWDAKKMQLKPTRSKWRWYVSVTQLIVHWMATIYLHAGTAYNLKYSLLDIPTQFIHIVCAVAAVVGALFYTNILIKIDDTCDFVNQIIQANNIFEGEYLRHGSIRTPDKKLTKIFLMNTSVGLGHICLSALMFLLTSKDLIRYFTYRLIERPDYPIWYGTPFLLFGLTEYEYVWSTFLLHSFIVLLFFETSVFWFNQIFESRRQLTTQQTNRIFRIHVVLNNYANEWVCDIVGLGLFLLGSVQVLSLFATIKFVDRTDSLYYYVLPIISVFLSIYMYMVFQLASRISISFENAKLAWHQKELVQSVNIQKSKQMNWRLYRSFKPVCISVGHFFIINAGTRVTYHDIVVSSTINLLLST